MDDTNVTAENDPPLPESLRRVILSDLAPVKPLAPAYRRAILLVPWTLIALATFWSKFGFRSDLAELGPVLAWGLSLVQLLLALMVAVVSLRESSPGSGLPKAVVWACAAGALAFHLAGLALSFGQSSVSPPPDLHGVELRACLFYELLIAAPLLLLGLWLLGRGLPLRPTLGGALAGLAAGLLADSSWRLICPFSLPSHVLPSHTGAILALVALGAVSGSLIDRLRSSRRR